MEWFESWPKINVIREDSKKRTLSSRELLILQSRSFCVPILGLKELNGEFESDKEPAIRTLYNILRELDTIEDSKLDSSKKVELIDRFNEIMDEIVRRGSNGGGIDDLVNGDLKIITDELKEYTVNDDESIFTEHFGRGQVLREFKQLDTTLKEAYLGCFQRMSTGMKRFLREGSKISNSDELTKYCEAVAGYVGLAINDTVRILDGVEMSDDDAKSFGVFLQSVNIMKNFEEDSRVRNARYIPLEFGEGLDALTGMLDFARRHQPGAIQYNASVPGTMSGFAYFSLVSLLAGEATFSLMEEGREKTFEQNSEYTKIHSNTFGNVLLFADRISRAPESRREFLVDYAKNPRWYSFHSSDFGRWAGHYVSSDSLKPDTSRISKKEDTERLRAKKEDERESA